jgi:large subunit ribosomal protein L21
MIAIIKTGGKQYLVKPGSKIKVEKLDKKEGEEISFDVLLAADESSKNGQVEIGNPVAKNAKVQAKILSHGKSKKVIVFKYKSKKRYSKKIGHRQPYTEVEITDIKN